jgi:hypothetical protein
MYFSNFYPQISVGTSSDTEFTLNTSLMPASSSTVFMSYFDRNYVTIEKLLADKGYYTFSAHANEKSMWNRNNMHPNMGYQEMIFKDQFVVTPETTVGLGLSDEEFYKQLQPKLEKIEDENENYMGTLIQLSNHSPFAGTEVNPELYDSLGSLDLTNTYVTVDEDGNVSLHELRGFEKVFLNPHERKTVTINVEKDCFEYFNVCYDSFYIDDGRYELTLATSSRNYLKTFKIKI